MRLHGNPEDPAAQRAIAAACQRLEGQMLQSLAGARGRLNPHPPGSIAWLCWQFQSDRESPYHELRAATRRFYDQSMKIIVTTIGLRRIAQVNGRDIGRWHRMWLRPDGEDGPAYPRRAKGCIQTLRRVVSDGVATRTAGCAELAAILAEMEFEGPQKRQQAPTYDQVRAFRAAAAKLAGTMPQALSVALGTTLQFELALRQKDIIGEWVRDDRQSGGLSTRGRRWQWGLTWDQIGADWILEKPTSKSNGREVARHDVKAFPDALTALQAVPAERRIGPVVVDPRTGLPFRYEEYARAFRAIADAAGWPRDLQNRDNRAGAITEAREAQTSRDDRMDFATHTQEQTARSYERPGVEPSRRIARARIAKRGG